MTTKRIKVSYGLDVSVSIRREGDTAFVDVHAPIYERKEWTMPHCYANAFTDGQILTDRHFTTLMLNHYGS
jgi:hypothetical protein